jgi:5-methylcytosine-specific restriction endonuclease McrA
MTQRICECCVKSKTLTEFELMNSGHRRRICRKCRDARYEKTPKAREKARQRAAAARKKREADGTVKEYKRRHRKAQRARYVAAGLTTNGTPRVAPPLRSKVERAAARAPSEYRAWRRRWLRELAPAECVLAWYAGTGRPWNSPRLSDGEKFTMRYRMDDVFRARQIMKAQRRKTSRAERVAKASDGSVTPAALGALFGEARFCAYCMEPFKSSADKQADHVEPLVLGGSHSMDNLVIACVSCNSSKGRKPLLQWLIAEKRTSNSAH